jgi:hypothetical protein
MPEELRITVIDEGGGTGGVAPASPAAKPAVPKPAEKPESPGQQQKAGGRALVGLAQGAGVALASGRVAGAVGAVATAAIKALTGPIGIAAASVAAAFAVATAGVVAFSRVITKQVNDLGELSAVLSQAITERESSRELARLRRADRIGPDLARITRLRTRWEDAMFDIGTEVLDTLLQILKLFQPLLDWTVQVAEDFSAGLEGFRFKVAEDLEKLFRALGFDGFAGKMEEIKDGILESARERILGGEDTDPMLDSLIEEFPDVMDAITGPAVEPGV